MSFISNKLSDLLTIEGYPKFKKWIINFQECFDKETLNQLLIYCKDLEDTRMLEDALRDELFKKIKYILITFCKTKYGKSAEKYFDEYLTYLDEHCFQGGFGYSVGYKMYGSVCKKPRTNSVQGHRFSPHHWCVKPEFYEKVKNIPKDVFLCACVAEGYISLSSIAKHEIWGN